MRVTALIVAAGSGSRMGGDVPKQYRSIGGRSVLGHAIDALASHPRIDVVRVVIGPHQDSVANDAIAGRDVGALITGGATRADSVRAGLVEVEDGIVLVHDAARPFCPPGVIGRLIDALEHYDGAVPVLAVADTLAKAGETIEGPIDREGVVRVQTPQAFSRQGLIDAYEAWTGDCAPTDEASVVRAAGGRVAAVEGSTSLEKLTSPADWSRAEAMLAANLVSRTGTG
ncbi:MAG: 2-C-methyl-D-erythritol 4-phosphate cytidylyltransferase, partial [Sphingomicrobium sp.]